MARDYKKKHKNNSKKQAKDKRKKKKSKSNYEGAKFIKLLNESLSHFYSTNTVIFDSNDKLLWTSGYISTGIKHGWKVLNDKSTLLEVNCNTLCMTISFLNYTIINKEFTDLNDVEKLYIFFLSYLIPNDKKSKDVLAVDYAVRKLNLVIQRERIRYDRKLKEYGPTHRQTRKSLEMIKRREKDKNDLLQLGDKADSYMNRYFKIDVCNNIDCEYLHKYKMSKNEQWNKTFTKFCKYITELFKGVIWLNMCLIFGIQRSLRLRRNTSLSLQELPIYLDIRSFMEITNVVLIPDYYMYRSPLTYESNKKDDRLYGNISKHDYWVYTGLNTTTKQIKKISVNSLKNEYYIAALLDFPYSKSIESHYNNMQRNHSVPLPYSVDDLINSRSMDDFIRGIIEPKLITIQKSFSMLGGSNRGNLDENIENSITSHWLVIHKKMLNKYITDGQW